MQGSPVVVTRVDLNWLHNLILGVSQKNFDAVEAYNVVDFLRLRMESARRTFRVMEKFPWLSAVSIMVFDLMWVRWLGKPRVRSQEDRTGGGVDV